MEIDPSNLPNVFDEECRCEPETPTHLWIAYDCQFRRRCRWGICPVRKKNVYIWEVGSTGKLKNWKHNYVVQSNHNIYYLLSSPESQPENTRSRLMFGSNCFKSTPSLRTTDDSYENLARLGRHHMQIFHRPGISAWVCRLVPEVRNSLYRPVIRQQRSSK